MELIWFILPFLQQIMIVAAFSCISSAARECSEVFFKSKMHFKYLGITFARRANIFITIFQIFRGL